MTSRLALNQCNDLMMMIVGSSPTLQSPQFKSMLNNSAASLTRSVHKSSNAENGFEDNHQISFMNLKAVPVLGPNPY